MSQDDVAIRRKIKLAQKHANEMKKMTPSDDLLADAIGITREIERTLADVRHRWERMVPEMEPIVDPHEKVEPAVPGQRVAGPPVAQGKQYEIVPAFKNVYSYNTPAILVAVAKQLDESPTDALMDMMGFGAVTLKWQLTKLRNYVVDRGVPVTTGTDKVDDHSGLDAPMIGKQRIQSGVTRVPIKPKDQN